MCEQRRRRPVRVAFAPPRTRAAAGRQRGERERAASRADYQSGRRRALGPFRRVRTPLSAAISWPACSHSRGTWSMEPSDAARGVAGSGSASRPVGHRAAHEPRVASRAVSGTWTASSAELVDLFHSRGCWHNGQWCHSGGWRHICKGCHSGGWWHICKGCHSGDADGPLGRRMPWGRWH